jgi:hypothetical protein
MPTTTVKIKNLALAHIGHSVFIDDDNEEGTEVEVLSTVYDEALSYVLEDFWWSFARRFVTLGLVTDFTALTTPQKWSYAYRYPVDAVTIRGIIRGPYSTIQPVGYQYDPRYRLDTNEAEWEVGSDDTGRLIYTNQEECVVEVTKLITDPALYPGMFAMALSWYLAFLIAPSLARDKSVAGQMMAMYTSSLRTAEAKDANESHVDPQTYESEAMRARQ